MALDDDIRVLSGVGLFSELTAEQLRLLAFGAESTRFAAGQPIYAQGTQADCAYIVVSGAVELHRDEDAQGAPPVRMGPGSVMGELALIAQTTRPSHALARTDTVLLRLNRSLFRRILEEYPDTAAMLHRRISDELGSMIEQIGRLAPRFEK